MLRENDPIGVIVIARKRVKEFSEKQIELVPTFADQAVIAIENVRLFDECRSPMSLRDAGGELAEGSELFGLDQAVLCAVRRSSREPAC